MTIEITQYQKECLDRYKKICQEYYARLAEMRDNYGQDCDAMAYDEHDYITLRSYNFYFDAIEKTLALPKSLFDKIHEELRPKKTATGKVLKLVE